MSCKFPEERLTALLNGELDSDERQIALDHIFHCAACRQLHASLASAWEELDRLAQLEPASPETRRAVERMIAASGAEQEARAFGRRPRANRVAGLRRIAAGWTPAVAVAAALVLGFMGGSRMVSPVVPPSDDLAQRLDELEQAVLVARLQSSDAVARLATIEVAMIRDDTRPAVVEALLQALAEDPSINVRLAAVEALTPALADREVALRAARLLGRDGSVLVQLALTERLGALEDATLREAVVREVEPDGLQPEAKRRFETLLGAST